MWLHAMHLKQNGLYDLEIGRTTLIVRAQQEDSQTWRLEELIPAVQIDPGRKPRAFVVFRGNIKEIMQETPWKRSLHPAVLGKLEDLHECKNTVES